MFTLDMRTVLFSYVITDIVSTFVILLLWLQNRKRFEGITFLLINFIFQTVALILIVSRGFIPGWISMDVSNTLVITGALLGLIGLEKFTGKKSHNLHNYILVFVFASVQVWFTFVNPDLSIRGLNISVSMLIICSQCVWLLLYRVSSLMRPMTRGVGFVFIGFCIISIARIIAFISGYSHDVDYMKSNGFEEFVLYSFEVLFILLTFSLVLMYNKRLLSDIEFQEEKYSKAFHASPYTILITRLTDGKIIEFNNGFMDLSGYQHGEILGNTTTGMHFWFDENDRKKVISELLAGRPVREKEIKFRQKSGQIRIGHISSEVLIINGENCILSSINDITRRIQIEKAFSESEKLYRSLFMNMLNGFAYCKMHYDEFNNPTDFTYLDVNSAFCSQTGLKDVVGRKVSDIIPGFAETDPGIIELYGRVALSGQPEHLESYVKSMEMWFWISVYCPERGYFVAVFDVITERKNSEILLKEKLQELEKFNRVMVGRENRMLELKDEINGLCIKLGLPVRYKSVNIINYNNT
jgi:PAS domain S-box-containing protein